LVCLGGVGVGADPERKPRLATDVLSRVKFVF